MDMIIMEELDKVLKLLKQESSWYSRNKYGITEVWRNILYIEVFTFSKLMQKQL
jgi:hypothetical protein